jgi:hypothetical protein
MVSVLASSAVDRGLELRSGETQDYKIGICCFSDKYTELSIMCMSGTSCLSADYWLFFSYIMASTTECSMRS